MKKILLSAATLAAMTTVSVASESSFFAAVYGGYMGSSTKVDANIGPTATAATNPTRASDLGGNGGQGGLMLGYNYAMENGAVVGLDVFGQFGSHEAKDTNLGMAANLQYTIKHKYAFGVAARFGYMFDTTHAYLRVGYINGRFEMAQIANNAANTVNDKKNLNGLLLGLGADMPVGEMITVGFNYDFGLYKKHTVTQAATGSAQFKPRTHALNVVLKYRF